VPTTLTTQTQLSDAVRLARSYRHHPDCNCTLYRDTMGEGFCTSAEAIWTRAVNRLLDELR
jgi:hypothetical protein